MARSFDFSGELLAEAISATFERRGTELPNELPIALSPEFFEDDRRISMWQAFFRRSDLNEVQPPFSDVGDVLRMFLAPVLNGVGQGEEFRANWSRGGSWDFDEGGR